jgi:hypothetical protein
MLERLIASRTFQAAMQMLRQLEFALFDIRLHALRPGRRGARMAELEVRREVAVVPYPDFNRFAHGFSHIFGGGYAAGYYSYKWAEVLSADAFSLFEENGVLDPNRAALPRVHPRGRRQRDPLEAFIAFRGRRRSRARCCASPASRTRPRRPERAHRQLERQLAEGAPAAGARLAGGETRPTCSGCRKPSCPTRPSRARRSRRGLPGRASAASRPTTAWRCCRACPQADVVTGLDGLDDPQRRVLGATVGDVRVLEPLRAQRPGGGHRQVRLQARLAGALHAPARRRAGAHPRVVVMGDFNIAPEDRDVHDPRPGPARCCAASPSARRCGGCSRSAWRTPSGASSSPKAFSWWDYRAAGFRRNHGLRIDLVLASRAGRALRRSWIDIEPRR